MDALALLGIVAALAVGVVSPGPSFVMVARTALAASRAEGVAAAFGMGAGGVLFAALALAGLQALLAAVPAFYAGLKLAGGLYLAWLGWRLWCGAREPLPAGAAEPASGRGLGRAFALGFATQASNPKTAIVYAGVFAAFLPGEVSVPFAGALLAAVFAVETGWYALVAAALASERPRGIYLRCKTGVDRMAGATMAVLGLKLAFSAGR